jgi:predicted RNase H-like HicB family nuclease
MNLEVIIEKSENELWGRIESPGHFLLTTVGSTTAAVLDNLRDLIKDYKEHEGKDDKIWKKTDLTKVNFDIRYDLQAFFDEHNFLNISEVAKRAGINTSLVRAYAAGVKHPSATQAKKIEDTLHRLATELQGVSLYAVA